MIVRSKSLVAILKVILIGSCVPHLLFEHKVPFPVVPLLLEGLVAVGLGLTHDQVAGEGAEEQGGGPAMKFKSYFLSVQIM